MTMAANFLTLWVMGAVGNVKNLECHVKTPTVLMTYIVPDPKKSTGMGWVGFVSAFHGYFWLGYPKRLVILGSFGYQTSG